MESPRDSFKISSVSRRTHISIPVILWFFTSFVTVCFLVPDRDTGDKYPYMTLLSLLLYYLGFFALVGLFIFSRRETLILDSSKLQYLNFRGKKISEYLLSDIIDFDWSNKPINAGTRHMYGVQLDNAYVIITFKDQTELSITREEFENFEEIRNYLYKYCINNKIIHVKPFADRR
jgi:hypothetical protein